MCGECGALQKVPDDQWLSETAAIYRDFALYHQSNGVEQAVFDAGGRSQPRSERLVSYLAETLGGRQPMRILDFGGGTGVTLRALGKRWPQSELYGAELSDGALATLQRIPNFVQLYTCGAADIDSRFDLIVMIHSLEHLVTPAETLSALSDLLTPEGHLFVQVPNAAENPYDLVVADHLSHFTPATLRKVASVAGISGVVTAGVVAKELTLVSGQRESGAEEKDDDKRVERDLDWLRRQLDTARGLAASGRRLGVFGSSIAAMWLSGGLGDRISFFVDEDPARIGSHILGRPILSVAQVPADAVVFVPLVPQIAAPVMMRLERRGIACQAA